MNENRDKIVVARKSQIKDAKQRAFELALPDPNNLTPRTKYASQLLGLQFEDYNHVRDDKKWKFAIGDTARALEEYQFYHNLEITLTNLHAKRDETIDKKLLDVDIVQRENKTDTEMIENEISKHKTFINTSQESRNKQFERYINEKTQQLEMIQKLKIKEEEEQQKQLRKLKEEEEKQILLFKKREEERLKTEKLIKQLETQHFKNLEKSAEWHKNVEIDRIKKSKELMNLSFTNIHKSDKLIEFKNQKYENLLELRRTQLTKQHSMIDKTREQKIMEKSNYFKNKMDQRAKHANKNLLEKQRKTEEQIELFKIKIESNNERMIKLENQRTENAMQRKMVNDEKIKNVTMSAKGNRERYLQSYQQKAKTAEFRRKEFQNELLQQRRIKNINYSLTKEHVTKSMDQGLKSKQFQNEIIDKKLKRSDQRFAKQKIVTDIFSQQKMKMNDIQTSMDTEFKEKIENALKNDNVNELERLLKKYANTNKQLQIEQTEIDLDSVKKAVSKQLSKG